MKKKVNLIATKYKNQKPELHFFNEKGERVSNKMVERTSNKKKLEFVLSESKEEHNRLMKMVKEWISLMLNRGRRKK